MSAPSVSVLIAARNAADTIGSAVMSALQEPEVSEVIVVDDESSDATGEAAMLAADNDSRLTVLAPDRNLGPAGARNLAIDRSTAPFVAILDADDRFISGRFTNLFKQSDWDLAADNIAFVGPCETPEFKPDSTVESLSLTEFVHANISRPGRNRGELGFLKPVIRRDFLDRHGLRYLPDLRLGEDYDLYVRALLAGGRFLLSHQVGYVAEIRGDSLSSRHSTSDLEALLAATESHLALAGDPDRSAIEDHRAALRDKYLLRRFLDLKSQSGLGAAFGFATAPLSNLRPIALGVLRDKLAGRRHNLPIPPTLLPTGQIGVDAR